MKRFWYIIKDFDNMSYDVIGPISNDDQYNAVVVDAQRNGFNVNAESSSMSFTENDICWEMENYGLKRDRELYGKILRMAK